MTRDEVISATQNLSPLERNEQYAAWRENIADKSNFRLRLALEKIIAEVETIKASPKAVLESYLGGFSPLEASLLPQNAHPSTFKAIISLFFLQLKSEVAHERLGWFWWVVEPLMNILVVFIITTFLHAPTIFDMPTFPFAVIGVTTWLIFRNSFNAVLTLPTSLVQQQDHYIVTPAMLILAGSLKHLLTLFVVASVLLGISILIELSLPPKNLSLLALIWLLTYMMGLGAGLIGRAILTLYKGARRIIVIILRLLSLISGLFFVSEQLPSEMSDWLLINPLLHATQLARSSWFESYNSSDASVVYFLIWVLPVVLIGLIALFGTRRQPL